MHEFMLSCRRFCEQRVAEHGLIVVGSGLMIVDMSQTSFVLSFCWVCDQRLDEQRTNALSPFCC